MRRHPPFILQRYIFAELVLNLVLSLFVITSVFVVAMVIQSLARYEDLPMSAILTVIPFLLPRALVFTIPLTALIASIQTYGRLAADNEILAVRVGGVHLWHVTTPVLLLGSLLSLVTYVLNAEVVPNYFREWKHLTRSSFDEVLTSMRTGEHEINVQKRHISLTANADGTFSNLLIVDRNDDGDVTQKILAKSARVSIDREDEKLLLHLENGAFLDGEVYSGFDETTLGFSLSEAQSKMRYTLKECPISELHYRMERPDLASERPRISADLHERVSMSLSSLVFILLGVPVGILFRRGGRMLAFFVSFLLVILVYYPLLLLGETLVIDGGVPASIGIWMGEALIAGIAAILLFKVFRE